MPRKQPNDRQPKQQDKRINLRVDLLDKTYARWEETRKNQIRVIERLQGIIHLARETAFSPSLSPEEALHKIKEILK